jgi:hypothetical protein
MNRSPVRPAPLLFFVSLVALSIVPARADETTADRGAWETFSELVDHLPGVLANRVPGLDPNGTVRIYSRPHLGDFFHAGYIRLPVGARAKFGERTEANIEMMGFAAHGITAPTRNGLAMISAGARCDHVLPGWKKGGFGLGFNYRTPLSQAPREFTDGFQHFQPYVSAARVVAPRWHLLGYSTFGLNFLSHTSLQPNFGRNQLHGNSMAFADGVTRKWKHVQVSLTARVASTALMSNETRQNFSLRPEIIVPWQLRPNSRTLILFTLDGRMIWGPDGRETGFGSGMRVQFHLDRSRENI